MKRVQAVTLYTSEEEEGNTILLTLTTERNETLMV